MLRTFVRRTRLKRAPHQRNGIMMISHYIHFMRYEGANVDEHMIIRGSL